MSRSCMYSHKYGASESHFEFSSKTQTACDPQGSDFWPALSCSMQTGD